MYYKSGSVYIGQATDTNTNAADAYAEYQYNWGVGQNKIYGTHTYKEAGYSDINLETYEET